MIAYQRNQILAVVLGAVALAHVSTAAAVADPSSANTLRRRNIAAGIDNKNNGMRAAHHQEHEHDHSLLDPVRKLFSSSLTSEHHAWWNKIQARKNNRAEGANSPTSFSNDGDCFLGMTVMGLPCDESIGTDNYVQPTTPSPTTAKPSAAPVTDAPTAGPTASPVSDSPTKSPTASPVTDSPTNKPSAAPVTSSPTTSPSASPVTSSPTDMPSAAPTTAAPSASPTPAPSTASPTAAPTTASPTASPTKVHSGSPSAAPTTASPTASPTEIHSGSPSAAPTTSAPTTLAPTTSSPTSSAPTTSPVAQDSTAATGGVTTDSVTTDSVTTDGVTTDSVNIGDDEIIENSCVPCTNIPTKHMLKHGNSCATYDFAFGNRCGTEKSWWGRDGSPEHCQYSCWANGAPYASQGEASCCARDDSDDITPDSIGTDGGVTTDSLNEHSLVADDDAIAETSITTECVQCTNIPTAYMLLTNKTCATYEYAFKRRCGTEFGWWGRDNNTEHCQYSCWANDAAYPSQGGAPCCERDDADDTEAVITGDSSGIETSEPKGETDGAGIDGDTITGSTEDEASGNETGDVTDGPEGTDDSSTNGTTDDSEAESTGIETGDAMEGTDGSTTDGTGSEESTGTEAGDATEGADGSTTDGAMDGTTGGTGSEESTGTETGDATEGAEGGTADGTGSEESTGTTDGTGSEESTGTETADATDGADGSTTDGTGSEESTGTTDGTGSEESAGTETGNATDGAEGGTAGVSGSEESAGTTDGTGSEESAGTETGDSSNTTNDADGGDSDTEDSNGVSDGTGGDASGNTDAGTTTDDGKDVDLSDDGSGIADPLDDQTATEYLPVPLTPFGVEITSEQPVDREVLSQVTGDFLHAYFEDELPKMGYPHYNNVALSAEQVNRRQRSLRSRVLQTVEQEIMISGNVNFDEEPLPDTQILDNLRSVAFAGEESKAAYLNALRNSEDPGLQSTTNIIVHEGDSEFNPSASERIQPGPSTSNDDDSNGFRSYVIAAMAALSFVVFGTALFLYNRKQMRDHRNDKDGLSEFSEEAPDSVLLKGDLGCSDSVDSHDELMKKVPAIEPEPISLIRDAKTLERAMIRSSYNRSVIEKANERVERKSIIMPTDDDDDSKTISFAEVIAKSHSQSPRTKGQWQGIEPMLSPMNNDNEKDISQNELLSPPINADPPTGQSFEEKENEKSSAKSIESDDPCLEGCANESPSRKLLGDGSSCSGTSGFTRALVACSPTSQFCGDDDNYSFHEGPVTDNSMAMPSSFTPTIELPPPPISMTMDKVSPNHQQIVKALAEGNPSTPFSLVSYTVHRGSSQEQSEAPVPALDVSDSPHEIEVVPSPNGRVGIDSHPNVVVEDYRPGNKPLGIAAHPYATVKSTEPLSP